MTFEHSIEIAAAPDELFALTQDYGRRLSWDPFLRSAKLVGGATAAGVGVRAYCVAQTGWAMETEYVAFRPPHVAAVRMTSGPWFIRSFAGSWRFKRMAGGKTRVSFRYNLRTRPAWMSRLLTPLVVRVFARETARRLAALKTTIEVDRA